MKAQISFVEYIVAFIVFFSFVAFFLFRLLSSMPVYLSNIRNELVRSETYQLSELLMNDPGEPINWDIIAGDIKRLGLSDQKLNKTNYISLNKITELNSLCSGNGYYDVKRLLGSDYDFSILLKVKPSGEVLVNCYPPEIIFRAINVSIDRMVAIDDGRYGKLTLQMW